MEKMQSAMEVPGAEQPGADAGAETGAAVSEEDEESDEGGAGGAADEGTLDE